MIDKGSFILVLIFFSISDAFPRVDYNFNVPNVVKPTVPDAVKTSPEHVELLRQSFQDPEVKPGLFQGDMAMSNEHFSYWRVALRWDIFPDKIWENGTIPYVISPLYNTVDYITIYKAISYLNYMTCVNFVPWDEESKDFLLIWPIKYPPGCWSFVGKWGGIQLLALQPPDENGPNCLGDEGRVLRHALSGFLHQFFVALSLFLSNRDTSLGARTLAEVGKKTKKEMHGGHKPKSRGGCRQVLLRNF